MAGPAIWEVSRGIWVALLAGFQQVGLNARLRIIRGFDGMDAMTIVANGFIGFYIRILMFKQSHGGAVEIGHICVKHIGGDFILLHQLFICMAFSAQLG